ncbi:MAG: YbjN domain-containing protein [Alphaproteobacteria bacterium]|nr:YbjN domain-containing protein [Alphaproteobacteria bacterium]
MSALQPLNHHTSNPLDRVERLAESHDWNIDRTNDHEVVMMVAGGWADLNLSFTWRDDLESLQFACVLDLRVPEKRQAEVAKLMNLINAQLVHGHFDLWADGSIVYRNALLLAGGAQANDAQCEAMIRIGVEVAQRYYPAIQFVVWAGHSAEDALQSALLETMGEA